MWNCKSVISFACRFPVGTLACDSHTPYTQVRNTITPKMDMIALNFCIEMEKYGVMCVPIPTNDSEWDVKTNRWRSIVSQKHAAQAAGLGAIGRHSYMECVGYIHCGYCEQYPCNIFPAEPSEEETISKIEVEKCWTWEDEKLMEAYAC